MEPLAVDMKGVTKVFFGKKANDEVDFKVRASSIHGLLGENGAGKTTLMNILYGLYRQDQGHIYIDGKREDITSPTKALSLGIGMVHQHFMLARPLSVAENIMLGQKSSRGIFLDTKNVRANITALSQKYNLQVDPDAKIWQLSVGAQQRVEILSAIYRGARILILDEPTAVLTPQETESLFEIIRSMKSDGKSIILITHKLDEIQTVADEVTVLRDGRLIGTREITKEGPSREELAKMMVGRDVLFNLHKAESVSQDVKLEIKNLCALNDKGLSALKNLSLSIRSGEILGLAGVDGNGQRELAETLTGLRPSQEGRLLLNGEDMTNKPPLRYIQKGVAHIPEDRHKTGLAMGFTLGNNFIIKRYYENPFAKRGLLDSKQIDSHADRLIEDYQIKANSSRDPARNLSGGNQQKLILARELHGEPQVLIASHPTRGLDIGAMEYVRKRLLEARNKGTAVLLISADLEEILQLSDRIAVIYEGELTAILPGGAPIETIGMHMTGTKQEEAAYE